MKRGLPKNGAPASSGREVRARRAVSAGGSASRRSSVSAPWWHQPALWLIFLATVLAINVRVPDAWPPSLVFVKAIVIDHTLAPAAAPAAPARVELIAGSAALWSPFFLAANAAVQLAHARGSSIPADGVSWPFIWAIAAGTAFYAFVGLWLSYRMALRFAQPAAALAATVTVWLASSLPVYLYAVPFSSHAIAMFSATLMLTLWLGVRDGKDNRWRWIAWGMTGGLAIATSLFSAALLIVAATEVLARVRRGFAQAAFGGLLFLAGAVAVLGPALVLERQIDGGWLLDGHSPIFNWSVPHLTTAAIAAAQGVFLWTPVALLGAAGLVMAIRRNPSTGTGLLVVSAAFFYLVAAYDGPRDGDSYGSPFLITLTPVFVAGLAALWDAAIGQRGRLVWGTAMFAAVTLILWNLGLMLQWGTGLIPKLGPIDFRQAASNQFTVVPRAAKDFVIRYSNERRSLVTATGRDARE